MKQFFDDLSRFLTDSLDNSEISKHFEKLNKILENYLHTEEFQKEEEKPKKIITCYFLASEVSKNKTVSSLSTNVSSTDSVCSTKFKLYDLDTQLAVGESTAFYNKIYEIENKKKYYNFLTTTSFSNGRTVSFSSGALLDMENKKYKFSSGSIKTYDYDGNIVFIDKIPDDPNNPDKFNYKVSFF